MMTIRRLQHHAVLFTSILALTACGEDPPTTGSDTGRADATTEVLEDSGSDNGGQSETTSPDIAAETGTPDAPPTPPDTVEEVTLSSDFGEPCNDNQSCESGWCVPGQEGKVCSDTCVDTADCPEGYLCKPTISAANATVYLCLPPILSHCAICAEDAQCEGGRCASVDGEGRCVYACETDDDCPSAYACRELSDGQLDGAKQCVPETGSCTCNAYVQGGIRKCLVTNDVGTCYGSQICKTSAGWTVCSATTPVEEICDGQDNNCDGLIDNDVTVGEPCENAVEGVGSCTGITVCSGEEGLTCQAPTPIVEVCDGSDNDCDDAVDEDFKDADGYWTLDTHCGYCGNDCTDKIVNGTGQCGGTPEGPVCVVATCDDGFVKVNDFQCLPPVDVTCAACSVDTDCLGGGCIDFDDQKVCMSPCNTLDNSCPAGTACSDVDGKALCLPNSDSCSCDLNNAGKTRPCLIANDAGTCQGTETCDPNAGWVGCDAQTATAEVCDGFDNDCDGVIDDSIDAEVCSNTIEGVGTCQGITVCKGVDGPSCQAPTPEVEVCDYQDNNCDGTVDEGFTDAQGNYTLDLHCGSCGLDCTDKVLNGVGQCGGDPSAPACEVGSCNPGYYQVGTLACLPATEDLCTPCVNDNSCPTPGDACLELDGGKFCGRDCSAGNVHGTPEDQCPTGFQCVAGAQGAKQCQPLSASCTCLAGDAGDVRPCSFDTATGSCPGQETCDPAQGWVGCTAESVPETCNFIDDDCDGDVDEDFEGLYTACSDGIGVCKDVGLVTCLPDGSGTFCSATAKEGSTDICDGLDNDCDGTPDQDYPGLYTPCEVGQGICKSYGFIDCTTDGTGTACNAIEAEAKAEVCDGLDNNCDGNTDEDFPTLGDICTAGEPGSPCQNTGLFVCTTDGTGVECSAVEGTNEPERCDNLDNDCDGETDELFPEKDQVCIVGEGVCANAGTWLCSADGAQLECSVFPLVGGSETCNGLDDDCNGSTDDGLEAPACQLTEGVCQGSVQTCAGLSGWLPCAGPEYGPNYQAAEATCDGLDNDCDGQVDNGLIAPACELQKGVCAGAFKSCGGSTGWSACGEAEYGGDYEVEETLCDGLDNDCDGLVDEGFTELGTVCTEGIGACRVAGTVICNAAKTGVTCSEQAGTPALEQCDGIDNDCDDATDEDFPGLGEVCVDGLGECAVTGTGVCTLDGNSVTCSEQALGGTAEACDGLDNDCDGDVDEDWNTIGQVCVVGTGACQATGTTVCNAATTGVECSAQEGPDSPEVCDGVDNDCDGDVDEDWDVGQVCVVGQGACQATGTNICNSAGTDIECSAQEGIAVTELCDGIDNNCNGDVDETWTDLGQVCVVGIGECQATGTNTCTADGSGVTCSAIEGSDSPETCDGLDNDCDGGTDENWTDLGQVCVVGVGECQATGTNQCNASGNGVACSASPGPKGTETCDGLDNDCDGATDENWPELGSVCNAGQGECVATGTWTCSAGGGGVTCGASPGTGSSEICDSLDNDCDGATDEDFKNLQGSGSYDADTACGNCFTDCTVIYGGLDNGFGTCSVAGSQPTCALTCCTVGIDVNAYPQCPDFDNDGFGDFDYVDADGVPDNGCEFQVDPSVVHVATPANGGTDGATCGSPATPCATIGFGIQQASGNPTKNKVWASSGAYYENIVMVEGIDVVGGHSIINWSYAPTTNVTVLYGTTLSPNDPDDRIVVDIKGITTIPTAFRGFTVYGEIVEGDFGNSIGILVENSNNNLTIEDVTIYAGNGGPGLDGVNGLNGSMGIDGNPGVDAHTEGSCPDDAANTTPIDSGGQGGTLICDGVSASGGSGGRNYCPDWDDGTGQGVQVGQSPDPSEAGSNGAGASGGAGGSIGGDRRTYETGTPPSCYCSVPPDDEPWIGGDGGNGGNGSGGAGGLGCSTGQGSVINGRWIAGVGTLGTTGSPGSGGGGGGTGGGVEDWDASPCNGGQGEDSVGGTGGGGGSGGCGGRSGLGGLGGGGAFGIFMFFSSPPASAPQISGNTIYTGRGGNGGNGGNGGIGGIGGMGAVGGAPGTPGQNDWCAAPGGRGGEGGSGGPGGGGGGGCGGVSFGIFSFGQGGTNLNTINNSNTFNISGTGGAGGSGGISLSEDGGNGADGTTSGTNF